MSPAITSDCPILGAGIHSHSSSRRAQKLQQSGHNLQIHSSSVSKNNSACLRQIFVGAGYLLVSALSRIRKHFTDKKQTRKPSSGLPALTLGACHFIIWVSLTQIIVGVFFIYFPLLILHVTLLSCGPRT